MKKTIKVRSQCGHNRPTPPGLNRVNRSRTYLEVSVGTITPPPVWIGLTYLGLCRRSNFGLMQLLPLSTAVLLLVVPVCLPRLSVAFSRSPSSFFSSGCFSSRLQYCTERHWPNSQWSLLWPSMWLLLQTGFRVRLVYGVEPVPTVACSCETRVFC